jgi:hypothetical protein
MTRYFTFIFTSILIIAIACMHYSCSSSMVFDKHKNDSAVFKFTTINKDFGGMKEGYVATHIFEFVNVGNKNLLITDVETECSCTISEFSKVPIKPNGKGFIKVSYKSEGNGGVFNKSITIHSNATEPEKKLHIKGLVFAALRR